MKPLEQATPPGFMSEVRHDKCDPNWAVMKRDAGFFPPLSCPVNSPANCNAINVVCGRWYNGSTSTLENIFIIVYHKPIEMVGMSKLNIYEVL